MVSDLMFCDIWKKRELCKLNQGLSGPLNGVRNADRSYMENTRFTLYLLYEHSQ